jgi:hypothetical protein
VAPEGLSRFYFEGGFHGPGSKVGATWMTREDRLAKIEDYVGYLDALHDAVFARAVRRPAAAGPRSRGGHRMNADVLSDLARG